MDFKALMTKLEAIDKNQVLTESEDRKPAKEKERDVTLPSGAKVKARTVQGWQSQKADKEADKEKKKDLDENIVLRSAIAKELLKEFNIAFEEEQDDEETLDEAGNPWANDPAKSAAWAALSPEDQKWLGGADPTDPFILARAPNKGKPAAGGQAASPAGTPAGGVDDEGNIMPGFTTDENGNVVKAGDPNFVEPATQKLAQQGRQDAKEKEFAAAADAEDQAMGQAMAANATGGPASVNAQGQNVTMPDGTNPETGEKTQTATAAAPSSSPLQLPPGAAPEPGMTVAGGKPAGGQAASPAKSGFKADPVGQSIANQLKMTTPDAIKLFQKNNGLTPDGQIGPKTTAALQAAAKKMGITTTSGVGTSTAGAGRGGQGGPTATQLAQAPAATPSANPKVAQIDAQLAKYKQYPQSNAQIIARLEKEKAALAGGQAASPSAEKRTPAEVQASKDLAGAMEETILSRIRQLAGM